MRTVDKTQLREWIARGEDVLLIDVLPRQSFRERHIPGSINISVKEMPHFVEAAEWYGAMPELRVVVYCANAQHELSGEAMQKLEGAGFTNAYVLKDGMEGWFGQAYAERVAA